MLKELLAPKLKSQKITIRQDEGSDSGDHADISGRIYPIVRILETVLNYDDIDFFELSSGIYSFYPRLTIQIRDINYRIREALRPKIDVLTLYVGSNKDPFWIKSDYLIESISGDPGSESFLISASLHVPKLLKTNIRGFADKSSIDVIKTICDECELGMLVNNATTNDKQKWIQSGKTNLDFISEVTSRAYAGDDTCFVAFIDHWSYLNFIDLKTMFVDKKVEKTDINPINGEKLEKEVSIELSNNVNESALFKVSYWSQTNHYSMRSQEIPNSIKVSVFDDNDLNVKETNTQLWAAYEQLLGDDHRQTRQNDNVHINYGRTKVLHDYNRKLYDQDERLNVELVNLSMCMYPSLYVPVKIFDSLKKKEYGDQTEGKSSEDLKKEAQANQALDVKYGEVPNSLYSGNYGIVDIRWTYRLNEKMIQNVTLIRLDDEKIDDEKSETMSDDKYVDETDLQNYDAESNTAENPQEEEKTNMSTFFDEIVKKRLFTKLSETQKSFFKNVKSECDSRGVSDLRMVAYMFATTYHETRKTMRPIDEDGFGVGRDYGIPHPKTGLIYYGRGYAQLTWYDNYVAMGRIVGVDLAANPDKAKDPSIAAKVLVVGMTRGLFTGVGLGRYFTSEKSDWKNARRTVNGVDRAELIGALAVKFYEALKSSNGQIS